MNYFFQSQEPLAFFFLHIYPKNYRTHTHTHPPPTHIVSHLEEVLEAAVHAVVVHGHEERVDDDAEGDEQLHEGIKHQQLHQLGKLFPGPATVPYTEQVNAFQQIL